MILLAILCPPLALLAMKKYAEFFVLLFMCVISVLLTILTFGLLGFVGGGVWALSSIIALFYVHERSTQQHFDHIARAIDRATDRLAPPIEIPLNQREDVPGLDAADAILRGAASTASPGVRSETEPRKGADALRKVAQFAAFLVIILFISIISAVGVGVLTDYRNREAVADLLKYGRSWFQQNLPQSLQRSLAESTQEQSAVAPTPPYEPQAVARTENAPDAKDPALPENHQSIFVRSDSEPEAHVLDAGYRYFVVVIHPNVKIWALSGAFNVWRHGESQLYANCHSGRDAVALTGNTSKRTVFIVGGCGGRADVSIGEPFE